MFYITSILMNGVFNKTSVCDFDMPSSCEIGSQFILIDSFSASPKFNNSAPIFGINYYSRELEFLAENIDDLYALYLLSPLTDIIPEIAEFAWIEALPQNSACDLWTNSSSQTLQLRFKSFGVSVGNCSDLGVVMCLCNL